MSDEPFAECDVCKKSFSGPEPFSEHLASKTHEKKMMESRRNMIYDPVPPNESADAGKLTCEVCNVTLTGEKSLLQHNSGRQHLSNIKKQNIMATIKAEDGEKSNKSDVLKCDDCQKSFSGPENLQQHLRSKKHARKMELVQMKNQLNGGVAASCPPMTDSHSDVPTGRLYPELGNDYNIVHQEIQNSRNMTVTDKKKVGCFPKFKNIFKKKEKETIAGQEKFER